MRNQQYRYWLAFSLLFLTINCNAATELQKRVALVIGNSDYKSLPKLKNPLNDASDMADKLKTFGFDVDLLTNANQRTIEDAISRLGKKLSQKNAVGLFYFAGHGVQVDGINYLIPVGANLHTAADVPFEAINAGRVLKHMEQAENNLNLIILDACRDNTLPSSKRSGTKGLAKMSAPTGSLILYATSPGKSALDGEAGERNGMFTGKLLEVMNEPGLSVYEVFKKTAKAVHIASGSYQTPYIEGAILDDFSFLPKVPKTTLTLKTSPENTQVRILNIPQKYQPGMALKPGRYHLEVTHPGYQRFIEWIEISNEEAIYSVVLEAEDLTDNYKNQSGKTSNSPIAFNDPDIDMVFVTIEPGCFYMGSDRGEDDEKPVHRVCLTKAYDIGQYEVTQSQWHKVMGNNPSRFKGDQRPVEQVSWNDVQQFIQTLNQKSAHQYRLPTEAEWEYAALAGNQTRYPWGNQIYCKKASFDGGKGSSCYYKTGNNYRGTQPSGSYQPNAFGIYDTVGNVWEWVHDWYDNDYYLNSPTNDPKGPASGTIRVSRGGSWGSNARSSRSSSRFFFSPVSHSSQLGFRLVRTR